MGDMETTYPGGGISTTTRTQGLPAMAGSSGGGDEMLSFFRKMAMRKMAQQHAPQVIQHDVDPRARMLQDQQMAGGTSFVKDVVSRPGIIGGYARTHAGDPGAVQGGWVPGGADQPRGGGDYSTAGAASDASSAARAALDWQRFNQEQRQRGMRTNGSYFDASGGGGEEY